MAKQLLFPINGDAMRKHLIAKPQFGASELIAVQALIANGAPIKPKIYNNGYGWGLYKGPVIVEILPLVGPPSLLPAAWFDPFKLPIPEYTVPYIVPAGTTAAYRSANISYLPKDQWLSIDFPSKDYSALNLGYHYTRAVYTFKGPDGKSYTHQSHPTTTSGGAGGNFGHVNFLSLGGMTFKIPFPIPVKS